MLDADRLQKTLDEQIKTGERFGAVLLRLGILTEAELLRVVGLQLGIPLVRKFHKDPPPLENIPALKFLKSHKVLPFDVSEGVLKVALCDSSDHCALEALEAFTGLRVEPALSTEADILSMTDEYYGGRESSMEKIIEEIGDTDADSGGLENIEHLKDMALEAPIINLVNVVFAKALERKASDIHIEPFEEHLHIRYRIDGVMYLTETLPRRLHPAVSSRIKIMAKLNIAERRLPQDGRIKLKNSGKDIDVRVSTIPTLYGESIVLRLLDSNGVKTLDSAGMDASLKEAFTSLVRQPHGMVLVTGPTGSGKTTTLYSALSLLDRVEKKIITIEDPVEYNLTGVNQIQVKPKIGLTFAGGLRSIVRQDPDVIMVGEIRDAETAEIAVHSALTGHLILSTLHTNDAPGAVTRLIDMGMESYLISSSLTGVLAQRLVRVICERCKEEYRPGEDSLKAFGFEQKPGVLYRGRGCEACEQTGYKGRTGIFELMTINDKLRHLIVAKSSTSVLREAGRGFGMKTLREDGIRKVLEGVTSASELARVTLE